MSSGGSRRSKHADPEITSYISIYLSILYEQEQKELIEKQKQQLLEQERMLELQLQRKLPLFPVQQQQPAKPEMSRKQLKKAAKAAAAAGVTTAAPPAAHGYAAASMSSQQHITGTEIDRDKSCQYRIHFSENYANYVTYNSKIPPFTLLPLC